MDFMYFSYSALTRHLILKGYSVSSLSANELIKRFVDSPGFSASASLISVIFSGGGAQSSLAACTLSKA